MRAGRCRSRSRGDRARACCLPVELPVLRGLSAARAIRAIGASGGEVGGGSEVGQCFLEGPVLRGEHPEAAIANCREVRQLLSCHGRQQRWCGTHMRTFVGCASLAHTAHAAWRSTLPRHGGDAEQKRRGPPPSRAPTADFSARRAPRVTAIDIAFTCMRTAVNATLRRRAFSLVRFCNFWRFLAWTATARKNARRSTNSHPRALQYVLISVADHVAALRVYGTCFAAGTVRPLLECSTGP